MCFSCVCLCSVCSLRIKFNIDFSFSEMRRLYWIKRKKNKKKQKAEFERVHERNFQNFRNFPRNFQFGYCGASDNSILKLLRSN